MKKTKRIVAFVLVLAFVFAFMAMSASAAMTEVQPRGTCPSCTHGYMSATTEYGSPWIYEWAEMNTCSHMSVRHAHYAEVVEITSVCSYCGYKDGYTYTNKYCPYE